MSKRRAANELTRDNWDDEEEKVEVGSFQMADESVLKNRIVKKAKRTIQRDESGEIKPIFSGFSGFNSLTSNNNSKQAFSFLSKCNEIPSESGNHPSASTINSVSTSSSLKFSDNNYSKSSAPSVINSMKVMKLNEAFVKFVTNAVQTNPYCVLTPTLKDYEKQINKFVTVSTCKTSTSGSSMTSNNDSPQVSSFENTETRFKDADEIKNNSVDTQISVTSFAKPVTNTSTNSFNNGFNFGNNNQVSNTNESNINDSKLKNKTDQEIEKDKSVKPKFLMTSVEEPKIKPSEFKVGDFKFNPQVFSNSLGNNSSGFVLGDTKKTSPQSKPTDMKFNPTPSFNFGKSSLPFSFNASEQLSVNKPFFSFGSTSSTVPISDSKPNDEPQNPKDNEDDEDQPPIVNFTPIKENDAIFESKCKLYYFENGKYEEHGVGQLYLKPVDNNKVQLIMRNESTLGTIMVNTLLNDSINFVKRNAKNVQLVCVVDPTKNTKPQTVLFKFNDSQTTSSFENELAKLKK